MMTICAIVCMQIEDGLPSRYAHSASAFNLSPNLTEVLLFGGEDKFVGGSRLSRTTSIKFGQFFHSHVANLQLARYFPLGD